MSLREYWRKVPPASVILAASHGFLGHMREQGKSVGMSTGAAVKAIRGKELFEFISAHGGVVRG
jgi:hypothetical protein